MTAQQSREKMVVSDKFTAGKVLEKVAQHEEIPADGALISDQVVSDAVAADQPLLMAKADIELAVADESTGSAVLSDADVVYTDHITAAADAAVSEQPELVAMNSVQHITDNSVQAAEVAAVEGSSWMWVGAAAAVGGGLGIAVGSNSGKETPVAPSLDVSVVVERDGAFIDTNANGVRDAGENTHANFQSGIADLEDKHVTVHFNDVPLDAINLTGFGADDKIQIDVASLQNHGLLNAHSNSLTRVWVGNGETYPNTKFSFSNVSIDLYRFQMPSWGQHDFNGATHVGSYGLHAFNLKSGVHGTTANGSHITNYGGSIAYWSDADNALNDQGLVLPDYVKANTYENAPAVQENLNDPNAAHGLIEFVWPSTVNVVVESSGAFIDANNNGVHDGSETTVAAFGIGGNADIAANHVTIHYNAVPDTPLNLAGFGNDDLIQIDHDAIHHGSASVTLGAQAVMPTSALGWGSNHGVRTIQNPSNPVKYAVFSASEWNSTLASYVATGSLKLGHFSSGGGFSSNSVHGGVLATGLDSAYAHNVAMNHVEFVASVLPE